MHYNVNAGYHSSFSGARNSLLVGSVSTNNRSRLDTGTSASSEDSKGAGKPPRRRSHRPRGCRGGSNRRKFTNSEPNKGNEQKQKQGNKGATTKLTKLNQASQNQNRSSMTEFTILSRQAHSNQQQFSDYKSEVHQRYNGNLADYTLSYDSFDNILIPHDLIQQSYSDSSSDFGADPIGQGGMFWQLDSESSSSHSSRSSVQNFTGTNNQILPPLPTNVFDNEATPSGPNPYALRSHNHEKLDPLGVPMGENLPQYPEPKSYPNHSKLMSGYATPMKLSAPSTYNPPYPSLQYHSNNNNNFENGQDLKDFHFPSTMGPPPPRPKPVLSLSNLNLSMSSINTTGSLSGSNTPHDYRAVRLEIQRQNVEGGSLFMTSPRSFLMGKRNDFAVMGSAF